MKVHNINEAVENLRRLRADRDFWKAECELYREELRAYDCGLKAVLVGFGVTLAIVTLVTVLVNVLN